MLTSPRTSSGTPEPFESLSPSLHFLPIVVHFIRNIATPAASTGTIANPGPGPGVNDQELLILVFSV